MSNFTWQHIQFEHGGNPYVCMTEEAFERIKKKYSLVEIKQNFWIAKDNRADKRASDLFYTDLLMEQQEQM